MKWDLAELRWMRSSRLVRASDCQCRSRNSPGFDPSILRHSRSGGATNETVLNKVPYIRKKIPLKKFPKGSAELWRAYRRGAVAADPSAGALQASWPAAFPAYHQIDLKDIWTVLGYAMLAPFRFESYNRNNKRRVTKLYWPGPRSSRFRFQQVLRWKKWVKLP
jgi:hypothetical protein